ncbi:hypothetical protein Dda_7745 [Drechslerella dactyloides]|uniref:Rho-GAP domain-containing protein n=1 Tax=Drechslerella dactyloides TaxID=74499 RepID=A0AAD6IUM9_DREDA|nr:hypothetical protein Dda_7745 [Drechslerella dactyloides]
MSSVADGHPFPGPASPPTKASLATWWDKFKNRGNPKKEEVKGTSSSSSSVFTSTTTTATTTTIINTNTAVHHPPLVTVIKRSRPPFFSSHTHLVGGRLRYANASRGRAPLPSEEPGIFGVPLQESIKYAKVAISMNDQNGNSFIYGYIPIVIAKCGVFLKDKATDVEGIFRLSGSAKRIKDLQVIFNSPDKYGKGLEWTGYTVHDAANILRRYLNQLPEPIIPLDYYDRFRQPLQGQGTIDEAEAIRTYQRLISELPPLNRQLLLYILDLLAVFSSKADVNLMPAPNLAAIFQPGIISHPDHEMSPADYRLSQDVLIFLILNQDNFLLGMRGSGEEGNNNDPQVHDQDHQPTNPPGGTPSKNGLDRHPSTGSAGAESVRKFGLNRVASTSSRKSASGVLKLSRSNTVPAKARSPATASSHFQPRTYSPRIPPPPYSGSPQKGQMTEGISPEAEVPDGTVLQPSNSRPGSNAADKPLLTQPSQPNGQVEKSTSEFSEQMVSPVDGPAGPAADLQLKLQPQPADPPTTPQPPLRTPTKEKGLSSYFSRSPGNEAERRTSNKLRKKRIPGSQNPSAESSTASLSGSVSSHPSVPVNAQVAPPTAHPASQQSPLPPISASPPASNDASSPPEGRKLSFQAQIPPSLQADSHPGQLELPSHTAPPHSRGAQSASTASLVQQVSQTPSQASSLSSQSSQHDDAKGAEKTSKHKSIWRKSAQKLNLGAASQSASEKLSGLISPPFTRPLNNSSSFSSLSSKTRQRSRSVGEKAGESPKESTALPQRGASASGQHNSPSSENVGAIGWLHRKINERKDKSDKEKDKDKDTSGASQRSLSPNASPGQVESSTSPKR